MSAVAIDFWLLFAGRTDVWGHVEGRCVREDIDTSLIQDHLYGTGSVGIYPLVDGKVKWGCSDIDVEDLVAARNLQATLAVLGITSWVERSKGKGYHVWVFAEEWVDASIMRNALLFAHQISGVPPIEVNPKQVDNSSTAEGLGNYVNLPYSKVYSDEGKRVVLSEDVISLASGVHGHAYPLEQFVEWASKKLNRTDVLTNAASKFTPPAPKKRIITTPFKGNTSDLHRRAGGYITTIIEGGPLGTPERPQGDRSVTLTRIAHLCREKGLTASEAMELIREADQRWGGKFSDRSDGGRNFDKIITVAYG